MFPAGEATAMIDDNVLANENTSEATNAQVQNIGDRSESSWSKPRAPAPEP